MSKPAPWIAKCLICGKKVGWTNDQPYPRCENEGTPHHIDLSLNIPGGIPVAHEMAIYPNDKGEVYE